MAEDHPSRYVKLTKDQAPMEEIKPGELNQPIDVPQLHVRKCNECGQPLPDSYQAPADEPWTTGIFGCAEDAESCKTGLFCPCVLFGRNVEQLREDTTWTGPCICHAIFIEGGIAFAAATAALHGFIDPRTTFLIGEGLFFGWWMCGIYTGLVRHSLQKKYHLKEHREMKSRLSEYSVEPMTMVNPPPVQEMNAADEGRDSASTSANGNDQVKVEMQAL
ncbi:Cell number regulator 6, variant 2 [Salvia divinorum]|uniref:Cell number regulator 6, variant 2 n=1 Tax=Salvia divinorum TaxID=28513 RepID=A0ABD1ICH5_SALDI